MMNLAELENTIKRCCGDRINKNELPCGKCRKRKRRIKNIRKEIEKMWELKESGLLDKPYLMKKRKREQAAPVTEG